jgi:hypothetical protein
METLVVEARAFGVAAKKFVNIWEHLSWDEKRELMFLCLDDLVWATNGITNDMDKIILERRHHHD